MTRGRRAALLLGLALIMGALAASDMSRRERALRGALEPLVTIVVARDDIRAGAVLSDRTLTVRRVPARYAPAIAADEPRAFFGARVAVDVPAGADVTRAYIQPAGAQQTVGPRERVVEIAATGSIHQISVGTKVDVVVTRENGAARLALQSVEVVSARGLAAAEDGPSRVAAGLRVTVQQAVYLASAQASAREIRLLPRSPQDRSRSPTTDLGLTSAP